MKTAFSLIALATLAGPAAAIPVTYSITATAHGWLNGTYFDSDVTLAAQGDTANVSALDAGYAFLPVTATVSVEGVGSDTLTDSLVFFVNQTNSVVGFYLPTYGDVLGVKNAAFATYDLKSRTGPLSGRAIYNGDNSFATTGGYFAIFTINSFADATFQAVPEPASMLALGIGSVAMLRRRKKA